MGRSRFVGDILSAISVSHPSLVQEFDEAIDLFEAALRECPEALWEASLWKVERNEPGIWPENDQPEPGRTDESIQVFSALWKIAYHCLFYLDWYVTGRSSSLTAFTGGNCCWST